MKFLALIVRALSTPLKIQEQSCGKIVSTSSPLVPLVFPDQKRWEQTWTPRHWSGFLSSLEAARAHWVLRGSWFSSLKHFIFSRVPMIRLMAASWALESDISSSYREKAWRVTRLIWTQCNRSKVKTFWKYKHSFLGFVATNWSVRLSKVLSKSFQTFNHLRR